MFRGCVVPLQCANLCSCFQRPAKITARLWRCPSTPKRWVWSWGCVLEAWSSSSFCWALSSSSLRKGKRLLISVWLKNMAHYAQSHHISMLFSFYELFRSSSAIQFLHLLNIWKGHACLRRMLDQQTKPYCLHSLLVHQRGQTSLVCGTSLSVKYVISAGNNSISHLIRHLEWRPDP